MYGALDVSTSALVAQRTRLNVISANIANQMTIENPDGEYEPYRRREIRLAQGDPVSGNPLGVSVSSIEEDDADFIPRYDPTHQFADEHGNVYYPNISLPTEQMDAMEAMRAYEANITAIEASKAMMNDALRLLV